MLSCSKRTTIQQVDYDLKGMLENKVEVQNLKISKISPFSENGQELDSVCFYFDLLFTEALFSEDFKFNKGMNVSAQNNLFIYNKSNRLVGLKLGRTILKQN
ncbi:hypothetical protein EG346_13985 [Chryseobacterium carnipullorum]|uniref:Lipoprotein n=2 Tax=Chryseobacterium carnipullorum TaxID=1124835 RepID=A0A376DQY5_CHRCU|nr:hypothetical protein EG346_13985 [Chryseobacterium carnipullorum]AZA64112.1 hypothetical protein EG345_04920 [Chryseobacterium carnipullorum]STC94027.1 Uncharacterised protein [Chryseobacterium carnipullorum]